MGLCSLPVQVWAAPKGLAEAVSHVADFVAAAPGGNEASRPQEDTDPEPFPLRQAVSHGQAESLVEAHDSEAVSHLPGIAVRPQVQVHAHAEVTLTPPAMLPPDPGEHTGLTPSEPCREDPLLGPLGELALDAAEVETTGPGVALDVPVILAAAGYRIAHATAGVLFPSHVGALEGQVRSASADMLCECGDQLTPVYPQVAPGFATFVASPAWFAEAKLVVAFLDARAVRGQAFAIVLSFPTTVQEINRVAGLSSVAAHDIFVSGQPLPLDEHVEVALPTGSLIRMLPPGSKPLWAAPLAFALWHPHYWPSGALVPRTRDSACALVLHSSGKYLYGRFCSDDWANQNGIASLVGVPLAEVRMQAADPAEMLPYVYRGAPVRGVIAVFERRPERDNQGRQLPYVVFLDSRPLGFDFNFVVCEQLSLSIDWLLQYLQQPPPAGWRLVVKGGQRQQDRVDFFPGEVLILGFQRCAEDAEEQPESEAGFSSDPEQDADSDSGGGHGSDSSTRSRSRDHTSEPHSKSEDRSYQGLFTPPDDSKHLSHMQRDALPFAELGPLSSLAAAASSGALQVQAITVKCCLKLLQSLKPVAPYVKCRVPDFSGQESAVPRRNDGGGRTLPSLPALRDIGDRSPRRPVAPEFCVTPQSPVPAVPLPTVRALFAVLIEGYWPEFVPLTLPVPCDIAWAMSELQTHRLPVTKRLFPKLVPVPFQPAPGFAIFLAAPRWPKAEVEVLLDCRSFSGQLHAAFLPPVVNAALLRSKAGIAWWRNAAVWIEPYVRPAQGDEAIRLYPGSVVVFLESESPPPLLGDLATMLRSGDCWDHLAPMPFLFDPALWILSDEGAFRFAIEGARPRRFVLAHVLEYDPSRLVAIAPEPPIRDFCDQGATTDAVLIVSQRVPIDRAWGSGACIVVIDQRPLLLGVTWTFVNNGLFSIGRFAADLPRRCPPGYQLAFTGALPVAGTDSLRVADATCLVVEFVPMLPPRRIDASSSPSSGSWVSTLRSSDDDSTSSGSSSSESDSGPPAGPPPPRPSPASRQLHRSAQVALTAVVLATCPLPLEAHGLTESRPICVAEVMPGHLIPESWLHAAIALAIFWYAWRALRAVSCKVADDPSFGDGVHWMMNCLCTATRLLQTPHFAMPRDLARLLQRDDFEDGLEDLPPQEAAVTFAILSPEYAPEFVTVTLQLPCTWGEAEPFLPPARATGPNVRFPHLFPAAQQHIPGFVLLTAAPRWDPHANVVCLNSIDIDGRVFAVFAPSYVDREGLCRLAALPSGLDYDVFVEGDDQPMARDYEVHLSQGMQVVFVEAGQVPTGGHALPVLLLSPANWDETFAFPEPALYDSYCIATAARHALCSCDFGRPWRVKRNIASTVGLAHQRFHVLPANPPVRDIAIQGVKCRTLLAACTCGRQEDNCQAFFVDLRPIREGLKLRHCNGFALDLDLLVETLSAEAPPGWRAQISDSPASFGGRVFLSPGAVLTVDYVPTSGPVDAAAGDRQEGGSQDPSEVVSSDTATLDTQGSSTGQDIEQDSVPPVVESSDDTDITLGPALRSRSFLILGQDFTPELIQIALPAPTPVFDALASVSAARKSRDRLCLPQLLPVAPQPSGSHALILAMPSWQLDLTEHTLLSTSAPTTGGCSLSKYAIGLIDQVCLLLPDLIPAPTSTSISETCHGHYLMISLSRSGMATLCNLCQRNNQSLSWRRLPICSQHPLTGDTLPLPLMISFGTPGSYMMKGLFVIKCGRNDGNTASRTSLPG